MPSAFSIIVCFFVSELDDDDNDVWECFELSPVFNLCGKSVVVFWVGCLLIEVLYNLEFRTLPNSILSLIQGIPYNIIICLYSYTRYNNYIR